MNNAKTPITIGMGWDFFTSEEKQVLCAELNRFTRSPQIELATLPFVPVDDLIAIWAGISRPVSHRGINFIYSLGKKLLALKTGHIGKMGRLG